ncbi:HPr family phosphocarrier protein [Halonatronum saccharophilum]|uniref:HPr family phosphocarrier protein n=1 Tax=Halonatronum saccharophilum TaxID=150060 RepID=UPI00047FCA3C|nr:HPr family phosphocarrier protein [Halonatronum saccharophilum]
MLTKKVQIINQSGLHARPASLLIDIANKFEAKVEIIHQNREANLKSIISVMSLAVGYGEWVTIRVEGDDAKEALDSIVELIEGKFGEK